MKYRSILFLFALFLSCLETKVHAQLQSSLALPLRIPLYLSGNFGELRNNHFHSGLDFKTGGTIGKRVYAVADGYLARIVVSPTGFGKALYINHPEGYTSVYGHLDRFAPEIARWVEAYQYTHETFAVDYLFAPGEFPISENQEIARSGDSGSSGGPHLHFELRNTKKETPLDPLPYFRGKIADATPPQPRAIALYQVDSASGYYKKTLQSSDFIKTAPNQYTLRSPLTAWGEIGIGIKAYDLMDGVSNIYGIARIELQVDDTLCFQYDMQTFSFDQTRYLNSYIDYRDWRQQRSLFQKSFIDPGNNLPCYRYAKNSGIIAVREKRLYRCRYILQDVFGNETLVAFNLQGVPRSLPSILPEESSLLSWRKSHHIVENRLTLEIPQGALYRTLPFYIEESITPYGEKWTLHDAGEPLHKPATLRLKLSADTLKNKSAYYICQEIGKKKESLSVLYRAGWLETDIRQLGSYTIGIDTISPRITPLTPKEWQTKGILRFRIGDAQSGIASYRAELDGAFLLFEFDAKTGILSSRRDSSRWGDSKERELHITVTDRCGNTAIHTQKVRW